MDIALIIDFVLPSYNEEQVLKHSFSRLDHLLAELISQQVIDPKSSITFVDDGSTDSTWSIIEQLAREHSGVRGIKLSKNKGHQSALLAGLFSSTADAVITIDADLQDDILAIEGMIEAFHLGHDIVYGVRSTRSSDHFFKRHSAQAYYKLMRVFGVELVYNHADFRLMSRRSIEALKQFKEVNLFIRGMIPLLGFSTTRVFYERQERMLGETKYPLRKMLGLAVDGITSFSSYPLLLITYLGFLTALSSVLMVFWILFIALFTDRAIPGWASTVVPIYFIGSVQLLSIGLIGTYISKIYIEIKDRPRFIIETKIGFNIT